MRKTLELIDNVFLKILANQNKAPYEMIKKRAKNKGLVKDILNAQLTFQHSKYSTSGQVKSHKQLQSLSKSTSKRSAHSQSFNKFENHSNCKTSNYAICNNMSRKQKQKDSRKALFLRKLNQRRHGDEKSQHRSGRALQTGRKAYRTQGA